MFIEIEYTLKNVFKEDFEDYIANKLEVLGFKCFKSVYAQYMDIESQIDIVAICRYCILCIECKSWNAINVDWRKSTLNWYYETIYGEYRYSRNPLRQSKNHAETLKMDLIKNIEPDLIKEFGATSYPCYPLVILKGDMKRTKPRLASTKLNNVYFCNDLEDIKDRYFLEPNTNIDIKVLHKHIEYLDKKQDRSEQKLIEHAEYIENCKKNRTGLWRPNTGIELYQM